MDHETAVRTQATERYLLGELNDEEREQFEQHFFSCTICADDLRAGLEFTSGARAVFREQRTPSQDRMPAASPVPWWRGSWALTASAGLNVALLGVVAALGMIAVGPGPAGTNPTVQFVQEVAVFGPQRGDNGIREISRQTPMIVVTAFLPEDAARIRYRIVGAGDRLVRSGEAGAPPREASGQTLLAIPVSDLSPGDYQIVLSNTDAADTPLGSRNIRIAAR